MAPMPPTLAFIDARYQSSDTPRLDLVTLAQSSLELDKRSTTTLSPAEHHTALTARSATTTYVPGSGTKAAGEFNNAGFMALFAILGAAMVVVSLWFFFWAKNGGFHYPEDAWDDYKSTVLRRKGPDGKTLSNATKSTKLGGSTIAGTQHFKWQKQAARSVVGRDEKGRKGIRAKRGFAKTHSILYSDDYMTESFGTETVSDMTEVRTEANYSGHHSKRYRDRDYEQYKKEKPARVGGLNRVADGNGSHFGTTTAGSETMSAVSESSERLLISKKNHQADDRAREKERAERRARDEAARMERRWKREAESAAAALAQENAAPPPPPPAHTSPRKAATPSSAKPSAHKQRHRSASRSASPKKKDRDFSYSAAASEVLSTTYTATNTNTNSHSGTSVSGTQRTGSYYDSYRPRAAPENPRYSSDRGGERTHKSRESSPKKGAASGAARKGGYRRGADSDLD